LLLTAPLSFRAVAEPEWRDTPARFGETWPTWQVVRYTYPGNELTAKDTLDVIWSDGGKYPPDELLATIGLDAWPEQGALVIGEDGAILHPHGGTPVLLPAEKFGAFPIPGLPDRNHYHQWVNACRDQGKTQAGFEYAGPLTEAILLGTIAPRLPGRELAWDAERMSFAKAPETTALLRRKYRPGWEIEGL